MIARASLLAILIDARFQGLEFTCKDYPIFPIFQTKCAKVLQVAFFVDYQHFLPYAHMLMKRRKRQIRNAKNRKIAEYRKKGMKQKRIARLMSVSPARVSQVLNPDPDLAKAKAAHMSLTRYKSEKQNGRLKRRFL